MLCPRQQRHLQGADESVAGDGAHRDAREKTKPRLDVNFL